VKSFLRGLKAWNSSRHAFGASQMNSESSKTGRIENAHLATQDALHPVVIRHPLSGREGIFVTPISQRILMGSAKQSPSIS